MEERRSYSKEFKLDAIELSNNSNKSVMWFFVLS